MLSNSTNKLKLEQELNSGSPYSFFQILFDLDIKAYRLFIRILKLGIGRRYGLIEKRA